MPAFISFRQSIRWLPHEASEPTSTVVLIDEDSGVFLDVRFVKDTGALDWAIGGLRSTAVDEDGAQIVRFLHLIDSRTLEPVVDEGKNVTLSDGTTLEVGEMVNPATGVVTAYEEVWRDEEAASGVFVRGEGDAGWRARVGMWQVGLGRGSDGEMWAWQAMEAADGGWQTVYATPNAIVDLI